MATSQAKDRSFTFTLSTLEMLRLKGLAEAEHRTAASWLRHAINTAWDRAQLEEKKAPKPKTKR